MSTSRGHPSSLLTFYEIFNSETSLTHLKSFTGNFLPVCTKYLCPNV